MLTSRVRQGGIEIKLHFQQSFMVSLFQSIYICFGSWESKLLISIHYNVRAGEHSDNDDVRDP